MWGFKNISIRKKLIIIQTTTAFVAVLLCCSFFLWNEMTVFKNSSIDNKYSLAKIIGVNSVSPLLFMDKDAANKILVNLNENVTILNAAILDKTGKEFAGYSKKGEEHYSFSIRKDGDIQTYELFDNKIEVSYRIFQGKEFLGTVLLRADLSDLDTIILRNLKIAGLILFISLLIAFAISVFLQQIIANRLLLLVSATKEIGESGNYSLRAPSDGGDEIGILSEGFNDMLAKIENTQNSLKEFNKQLEEKVEERTADLKKAQATLELNKEKYRKVVDEVGELIYSSDYKGNFTYINPICQKLTGYMQNELIGKHFTELIDPEWKLKVAKFYKNQFDNRSPETTYSFPIITKSGERKWVEQNIIQNTVGDKITGYQGIVRDITLRKRMEDELTQSNERFSKIFKSNPIAMIQTDVATDKVVDINKQFIELFGYKKEEIVGKKTLDLNMLDMQSAIVADSELAFRIKTQMEQKGYINDIELRARKKNGELFWALVSLQITMINDVKTRITSVFDISGRKKAEQDLKFVNNFLDSVLENIPNMIFVKDAKELRFVRFNKAGEKLLGYSQKDLIGKNDYDFFPKEQADFFTGKDHEVINKGEIFEIPEEPIDTKTGKRWLHTRKIVIKDEHNNPLYLLGISEDITESKKAHDIILQKSVELENTNKELEQFVFVASHDLQEPLRTISNFIGLLGKKQLGKTDKEIELYFQFIMLAGQRMQNLIRDLLDLSRAGRSFLFVPVNCEELLNEVIAEMGASIEESKAKIMFTNLPVIKGDRIKLKQLFQNLISNAIKFRKKDVVPEIHITAEEKNNEYLFAIQDNGIGIEEQYFKKLFIIFQRLHSATEYPGTGIGLATCKKIVTLHNGEIWVESKYGEGSTFYFTISKKLTQNVAVEPTTTSLVEKQ